MSLEPRCATKFNNDATLCPALCPCLATRPYVASCLACSVSLRPLCMFIPLTLHLASCYDLMLHTHVPGCHGLFPVSYTASCLCSRCIPSSRSSPFALEIPSVYLKFLSGLLLAPAYLALSLTFPFLRGCLGFPSPSPSSELSPARHCAYNRKLAEHPIICFI